MLGQNSILNSSDHNEEKGSYSINICPEMSFFLV